MEGFFCVFFDFFTQAGQKHKGECHQPPHKPKKIRQAVAQPEKPPAEQPEIEGPACQAEQGPVQPDLSAPGLLGPQKERQSGPQPEQQVQQRTQQGQMHPHPKDAEQVVQHSGGQAQHHGLKKSRPLGGYVHRHPPSRREISPPLPRRSSS